MYHTTQLTEFGCQLEILPGGMMESLQFNGDDPGAVTFGNFINYYNFHPPEERLKLLPSDQWLPVDGMPYVCLDIGCNTGELTMKLHESILNSLVTKQPSMRDSQVSCTILGVDIDPTLIERAQEKNKKCSQNIIFKHADFMNDDERIRVLRDSLSGHNGQFDVVFCFSITMWIHLNHGDDGLRKFLSNMTLVGKLLVIEPQPWKCYKSAVKRLKRCHKSFSQYDKLSIREDVEQFIENYLIDTCNFIKVYQSEETKWGRKILFFRKQNLKDY